MLIAQRDRKQHFWQLDLRECRDLAHLAALPPKQRIKRVNQLTLNLSGGRSLWLGVRTDWKVHVACARTCRRGSQLRANKFGCRKNLATLRIQISCKPSRFRN